MTKTIRVAIDGPSGAGKSTLARSAAARLNFLYVDTGAIYRTIGCAVRRRDIDPGDRAAVVAALPELDIGLTYGADGLQHMELNGEDVTAEIRLPEISRYASVVSAYPEVRAYLLEMQRRLAREHSVIMDGRDIGTVVLPDAEVKVFLTASAEERARRRMLELQQRGTPEPYEAILRSIQERDWNDSHRAAAPLRQAVTAALPEDLEISPRDRGLVTWTLHFPDSDAFVQMEWVGDTAVSLAGQYNAGATLDTAAAADALCALLGLDTLADWQTLAATPAHGTLHTRYSADGQLYLHATFQEGYFSVGVSSVPEDDLAGLA